MSELAALVVGCGGIGSEYDRGAKRGAAPRSHAGAYAANVRTTLSGGVDTDPAARERFTELWGVPCYASLEEGLAACKPAIASVATPPDARREVTDLLLRGQVRAIWMEKPLADSVAAGAAIVEAAERDQVPLQVNFLRRFDPLHRRVADAVHGRVLHADFRFGGTLENYGSHAIDLFRWLVGEPARVGARDALVELATADGRHGTLRRIGTGTLFDCDLWLDDARYSLTAGGEQLLVAERAPSELFAGVERSKFGEPDPERGLEHAMSAALDALLDGLERGAPLLCDGRDGLAELRIRDAAARAAESGQIVALEALG